MGSGLLALFVCIVGVRTQYVYMNIVRMVYGGHVARYGERYTVHVAVSGGRVSECLCVCM